MKIAVLSSHTPSMFWFRMDMMRSFIARGHEVTAIGNEDADKWREQFSKEGIRYIKADINRNGMNPLSDLKMLRSLKKILKAERPDKIFTYQAKTVIYGALAANSLKIDTYPLIAGLGSVFMSRSPKAALVRAVLRAEYKLALKNCDRIFFQNKDDVAYFCDNGIINDGRAVMLGGSGVNLDVFRVTSLPSAPAFLFIGRLIRDKGVFEYLEAARIVKKKYPDVRFLLVGPFDSNPTALKEDELEPYLADGTAEYFGEQSDVRPYINMCTVFVLPSYREGTPKTVLEAMATGRAVITTDAPGCRETVKDGENGFLVPIKDVSALAEKMELLLNSPETVSRMAVRSREIAELKFDVNKVNETIIKTMGI